MRAVAVFGGCVLAAASVQAAPRYHVRELPSPLEDLLYVYGVNDFGVATGTNGTGSAVIWSYSTSAISATVLAVGGVGRDVSDTGVVPGLFLRDDGFSVPAVFSTGGVVPLPGEYEGWAGFITPDGRVGGAVEIGGVLAPILWTETAALPDFRAAGEGNVVFLGLDDANRRLTLIYDLNFATSELWTDDERIPILVAGGTRVLANAISPDGIIVGSVDINGEVHPFFWQDGWATLLPYVELFNTGGVARDVNAAGQIVGDDNTGALLWIDGQRHRLNDLVENPDGWYLQSANAISEKGVIVGEGTYQNRNTTYILTPIPEPGAMILPTLAGGLMMRRRRV